MTLTNLPPLIFAFLKALDARDATALAGLFEDAATLTGLVASPVDDLAASWCGTGGTDGLGLHPINIANRGDGITLTALVRRGSALLGDARPVQIDLAFALRGGLIVGLDVSPASMPRLDAPVADFVAAMNDWDVPRVVAAFAEDALLNDQLEEYRGFGSIQSWAARTVDCERFTMFVTEASSSLGCTVVRANVDGDYDRSQLPDGLRLSFYFFPAGGRINQLFILQNHSEVAL